MLNFVKIGDFTLVYELQLGLSPDAKKKKKKKKKCKENDTTEQRNLRRKIIHILRLDVRTRNPCEFTRILADAR